MEQERVTVLPSAGPDADDAIVVADGRVTITTDVPAAEVRGRLPDDAPELWAHPATALWLAERSGRDPSPPHVVLRGPEGRVVSMAPDGLDHLPALVADGYVPVGVQTLLHPDRPPAPIPAGADLELRPIRLADVEAHRELDDEATRLGFGFPRHATAVEVHLTVARWRLPDPDRRELGVWRDGRLVGHVSIWLRPDGDAEVAYAVAPAHRRQGIAVAAARAALGHAAATWACTRAVIEVRPENAASRSVARRLGAIEVGEADGHVVHHLDLRAP